MCYCGKTDGTDTKIRVSTESWPWWRTFSCRDLNPQPFNHECGALTTELFLPASLDECWVSHHLQNKTKLTRSLSLMSSMNWLQNKTKLTWSLNLMSSMNWLRTAPLKTCMLSMLPLKVMRKQKTLITGLSPCLAKCHLVMCLVILQVRMLIVIVSLMFAHIIFTWPGY